LDLFSFFFLFLIFFFDPSLEDEGGGVVDDIGGENHLFKNFFSNDLTWNGMVMTVDILVVDAYSGIELCTPI
jgi:hypothetical protein